MCCRFAGAGRGPSDECDGHTDLCGRAGEALVRGADRRAGLGRYGHMQGVARAQAELATPSEMGGHVEMAGLDGYGLQDLLPQHLELIGDRCTNRFVDGCGAQFDGQRRGEFGHDPIADDQGRIGVSRKPCDRRFPSGFMGQRPDQEGCVQIPGQ